MVMVTFMTNIGILVLGLRSAILSMRREDKHTMPLLITELAVGRTRHSLGLSIRNRVSKSTHSLPTTTYTYVLKPLAS